ncbi:DsbA family protein [Nonomuraea sp. ATR24]|uniref:DsbA family protein n=1 Tax=Nonomuraea sp. ATR24 TaxID=1676744 RepID=UPI0035C25B95
MNSPASSSADAMAARRRRSTTWTVVLSAVVVFLAIVVTAQLLPQRSPAAAPPAASPSSPADQGADQRADQGADQGQELEFVRRDAGDPMAIGDVNAPVVLTEWIDLRCPYCAVFSRETLPALIGKYVDTGKVRIEFHDVTFFGGQSEDAAVAARAAGRQDRFVEFVTAVYAAAPDKGHADLPRDTLVGLAKKAGVPDIKRFTADLDDPALRAAARASTQSAQQLGVTAVPFFVAGNTSLSGAQPAEVFQGFLDQALDQAK